MAAHLYLFLPFIRQLIPLRRWILQEPLIENEYRHACPSHPPPLAGEGQAICCANFALTALFHVKQWDLFSDTEPAENLAEQIIRGEFSGNLVQRALRQAQLLGKQLRAGQYRLRPGQVGLRQR